MENKLLQRQLKKHFGEDVLPEKFISFLNIIGESYNHYEKDRLMLERSIELTSEEMIELNQLQKKAHDELKSLLDNIEEVFFSVSFPDYQLLQMSNACEKIFGYPVKDFKADFKLWYDVILDEDKKIAENNYSVMNAGNSFIQEYRIRHKDGSIRWVETKISPALDKNGKLIRMDGITTDITSRKESEVLIQNSERRFRTLIENSADMLLLYDNTLNLLYCSYSVEKLFGCIFVELQKKNMTDHTHPEDVVAVKKVFDKAFVSPGIPIPLIIRQKYKNNAWIWLEGTVTNRLDDPAVNAIVCNYRNITERKRAEEEKNGLMNVLKESEKQFHSLFNKSRDPIFLLNENQQFINCNEAAVKMLGAQSMDEIINKLPKDFSPEFQPDGTSSLEKSKEMDKIAFANGSAQFEWTHKGMDGSCFPAEVSLSVIPMENKNILLVHWRDITERKRTEEQLIRNNMELKKSNSELDKFVYSVSHDLRAPLSSMFGVIQISEEETKEPLILEHLGMLKGSIKKLDGFIADILDYSRNSRLEVKKEEINFKEMLESISSNLKFMGSKNRMVDIKVNIHNEAPFYSDMSRLSIVLNNLISNAIRYQNLKIENPFVDIKVDTSGTETNIIVKDNGIGISREKHEKIFEMFYRVSESSVGSGLGLYIVKETLNKLNGNIEVESELGKGTTFIIHLPNLMSIN